MRLVPPPKADIGARRKSNGKPAHPVHHQTRRRGKGRDGANPGPRAARGLSGVGTPPAPALASAGRRLLRRPPRTAVLRRALHVHERSEEHTSELQSRENLV